MASEEYVEMWPPMPDLLVLAMHHGHRVPANQALDAALELTVAGIRNFLVNRNCVHVRRVELNRNFDTRLAGTMNESVEQFTAAIFPITFDYLVESF